MAEQVHFKKGRGPKTAVAPGSLKIRGFARGCLIDPDGTEHMGDWHENALSTTGVQNIMLLLCASTRGTVAGAFPGWIAVGSHTAANSVSSGLNTEYAPDTSGASTRKGVATATASVGTLSYTAAFASSEITSNATINAVAILNSASTTAGTAFSIATFASSTKGANQALNVTYQWNFAT